MSGTEEENPEGAFKEPYRGYLESLANTISHPEPPGLEFRRNVLVAPLSERDKQFIFFDNGHSFLSTVNFVPVPHTEKEVYMAPLGPLETSGIPKPLIEQLDTTVEIIVHLAKKQGKQTARFTPPTPQQADNFLDEVYKEKQESSLRVPMQLLTNLENTVRVLQNKDRDQLLNEGQIAVDRNNAFEKKWSARHQRNYTL